MNPPMEPADITKHAAAPQTILTQSLIGFLGGFCFGGSPELPE